VTGLKQLKVGDKIMKSGRSTGCTRGKVELVYSKAKLEGSPEVTPEFFAVAETVREPFCELGDSGDPVLNTKGKAVGLILGGTSGEAMELEGHQCLGKVYVSYISTIVAVISHVNSVTGMEVVVDIPDLEERRGDGVRIIAGFLFITLVILVLVNLL